jgi:murein DD-endopeptidase MepM/ murein hydrolase activator NlpD
MYAAVGGDVIGAGPANGFGLAIRIRDENNVVHVYGHMREIFVSVGDKVATGDLIAKVSNAGDVRSSRGVPGPGNDFGSHLHYEVRPNGGTPIDPITYLASLGVRL